jgi:hypothetical protein
MVLHSKKLVWEKHPTLESFPQRNTSLESCFVSPGGDAEEAWAKRAQHEKQQGGENSGMSEAIKEPMGQDELVFLSR